MASIRPTTQTMGSNHGQSATNRRYPLSNTPPNPPQTQGAIAPPIGRHELMIVPTKHRIPINHEGQGSHQWVVHVPKGMQVNERVDASGIETQHGGTVAPITIIRTGDSIPNDNGGACDGDPNHIWLGEPGDERSEDHDRVMVVAKGRKRPQPAWLYSRSKVNGYIELEWQPIQARSPEL